MAASSQSQFPPDLMLCRTSVSLQEETVALEDFHVVVLEVGLKMAVLFGIFQFEGFKCEKVFINDIKAASHVKFSHASRSSVQESNYVLLVGMGEEKLYFLLLNSIKQLIGRSVPTHFFFVTYCRNRKQS